jgi:phage gp36-like protein
MAYATLAELKARLGSNVSATAPGMFDQLTDRTTAVTANDTEGNAALAYADSFINAKVGKRYAVPVVGDATALAFLRDVCLDIAEWRLWSNTSFKQSIPERVKDSSRTAFDLLDAVADGDAVLPSAVALSEPTAARGSGAVTGGDDRVFTSSNLGALI